MNNLISAIPRRAAPVACFVILLFAQSQDLSAQRAKRKDKTRVYTIDLSQSRVTATLTQEGFISRRYPNHRVEVKNFSGKIEVSERDETRITVEVESEAKSLTNADEGMTEFERREFQNVLNNLVLESDKFPKIKFVSVSISDARKSGETRTFTLNGDLTLRDRSEEHTSELQSLRHLVCRLLLEKKKKITTTCSEKRQRTNPSHVASAS